MGTQPIVRSRDTITMILQSKNEQLGFSLRTRSISFNSRGDSKPHYHNQHEAVTFPQQQAATTCLQHADIKA